MKSPRKQLLLRIFLIIIIISQLFFTLLNKSPILTRGDYWERFPVLEKQYLDSQYVNKHPKGWIPDEGVNAYAGGALIKGINPIYVIPDTPPLGKYLIGLSAIIFNNESLVILIFSVLALFLMYLIGVDLFRSQLWALLPPALLSLEKIFQNQLIYTPLYDIFQLVFLLLAFLFFNKALKTKRFFFFFLLSSAGLGLFISTKFFATGITILAAGVIVLTLNRMFRSTVTYLFTSFLAVVILLISYLQAFLLNPNFREFLGIQKWVFLYHKSQLILPFSIWPLIMLNRWHVWFGDKPVINDAQWQITWPLLTIFSFLTIFLYLLKKIKKEIMLEILMAWIVLYFLFFSFGQITSRYFVILIPILYLVSTYGAYSILSNKSKVATKQKKR